MFESNSEVPALTAPTIDEVKDFLERLAVLDGAGATEAEQLEYLAVLEGLKGGTGAAQARVTDNLAKARTASEAERGIPSAKRCQGLAAEIALARRISPHQGARELGLAKALVREMPHTHDLLTRGEISEWRATLVVRETAVLSLEHRQQVDVELTTKLAAMGDREAAAEARKIGYRLDPGSAIRRTRGARSDRNVTLRPAPDTMTYLTGFLPVEQGVACIAALRKAADTARADGDARSRGQVMADTLVQRVTGRADASALDVEVQLVMTDSALLSDDHSPAHVVGLRTDPRRPRPRHRPPGPPCLAAPSLPQTRVRGPGRDGLPSPRLRRRAARAPRPPRPDLPDAVVRRPDPARRPSRARR